MRMNRVRLVAASIATLALMAGACGGGGKKTNTTGTTSKKEAITIAAFNFSESAVLAGIYGKALQPKGYTVTFKNNLGQREVVEPALLKGEVDGYATYAATELTSLHIAGPAGE